MRDTAATWNSPKLVIEDSDVWSGIINVVFLKMNTAASRLSTKSVKKNSEVWRSIISGVFQMTDIAGTPPSHSKTTVMTGEVSALLSS